MGRTIERMRLRARTVRPSDIRSLTGLSVKQFGVLVGRLWELRPDRRVGRPWALTFPDRVLLVTLALRTNLTERQLAALFDVSQSSVDRVVRDLTVALAGLLGSVPVDRRHLWVVDGTLIPVEDQRLTALCKNYRRSVNVQVVIRRADRRVVAVGDAWPGNRNDPPVFRATVANQVQGHRRLIGDGGYRGVEGVTSPIRGPDGRIVRDPDWVRFRRRRASVEHVIAELKVWQVLRRCRRKGPGIDQVTRAVAALYNLRIDTAAI